MYQINVRQLIAKRVEKVGSVLAETDVKCPVVPNRPDARA